MIVSGRSDNLMDNKNRIILPVKFREQLANRIWVMPGIEKCIYIYDEEGFNNKLREIRRIRNRVKREKVIAYFFNHMDILDFDNTMGRVLISKYLKEHANLEKEIIIVGSYDRIEIWDAARYEESRRTIYTSEVVGKIMDENAEYEDDESLGEYYDGF